MSKVPLPNKGYGSMSLTWTETPQPFSQSVELLTYIHDKKDVRLFNGSTIYQLDPNFANIKLFAEFFEKVPPKDVVLTYKVGVSASPTFSISSKPEDLDKDIKFITDNLSHLKVKPKIVVVIARIDRTIPIEDTVKYLHENHVSKGTIDGIGLSECSAETITKAAKAGPISVLELEFSMLSQHLIELGILKAASELEIPIICYSPLCRGILTDVAQDPDYAKNLPPTDRRVQYKFDRFTPENFEKNYPLLKQLGEFATKKNVSISQLAIGYLYAVSGAKDFEGIPKVCQLIPIPSGTTKEKIDANYDWLKLTDDELRYLQDILNKYNIAGLRYNQFFEDLGVLNV